MTAQFIDSSSWWVNLSVGCVLYKVRLLVGDYGITPRLTTRSCQVNRFARPPQLVNLQTASVVGTACTWHTSYRPPNETFDKLVISFARFLSHHLLLYHAVGQANAAVFMHFPVPRFLLLAGNMSRSQIANKRYCRVVVPDLLKARFPSISPLHCATCFNGMLISAL